VVGGDYVFNGNLFALVQQVDLRPGVIWTVMQRADDSVAGYVDTIEASAGNPPTRFLVTMDFAPVTYVGAPDIAALEAAAQQLGFRIVATHPLTGGREARLWERGAES
jgi:hypothetical protein